MEIEFRAKDADDGIWRYGYYVMHEKVTLCVASDKDVADNQEHYIIFDGFSDWNLPKAWYRSNVDPKTLGQYINIRDAKKNKIYVGDILEDSYGRRWVVHNSHGGFRVCREKDYESVMSGNFEITHGLSEPQNSDWTKQLEIIGNVHDNPELLTEVLEND